MQRIIVLMLICFVRNVTSFSQKADIDSLRALLKETAHDTVRLNRLVRICESLIDSKSNTEFREYLTEGMKLASETGKTKKLLKLKRLEAQLTARSGDYDGAIKLYEDAFLYAEKFND